MPRKEELFASIKAIEKVVPLALVLLGLTLAVSLVACSSKSDEPKKSKITLEQAKELQQIQNQTAERLAEAKRRINEECQDMCRSKYDKKQGIALTKCLSDCDKITGDTEPPYEPPDEPPDELQYGVR
jgi:hypothetical protein